MKKTRTCLFFISLATSRTAMDTFVLASLVVVMTVCATGRESTQARGFDEDPWNSMNQQPEVLIVKEKGGGVPSSGSSGMKMKDLTPIICLLAPLLLAAILIPAKMTMMLNGMMGNNGIMPFPQPFMQTMMMPNNFPFTNSLPLTALLTSGMGSGNNPFGLPIFKDSFISKMFPENVTRQNDKDNNTYPSDKFNNEYASNMLDPLKENEVYDWFFGTTPPSVKTKKKNKTNKKNKGDIGKTQWSTRVWSEDKSKISLADEIIKLFEDILSLV